jgi:four helix bundle protein
MTLPHHSLIVWQRADDLFISMHSLSRKFPPIERYELASQLRRAAFSVPVNIVEGLGRRSSAEKLHFLQIASSSLGEVGYCLHAAMRLGYLTDQMYADWEREVRRVAAPLRGLMKSLGKPNP